VTRLQEAAYAAERAAGLPTSPLARQLLSRIPPRGADIEVEQCAAYLHAVQDTLWFRAAFPGHVDPVVVVDAPDTSHADADRGIVGIGRSDRGSVAACERACLHELAHIVTPDHGPDRVPREPATGSESARGHHHAWRVNYVLIVRQTLGPQAAQQLRHEFDQWGLPTAR
jgi:putative metallohydrolase (TIGR04338 family)